VVFVPSALEPRLKKCKISLAMCRQGPFNGGKARRSREAGLVGAADDPAVGSMLAGEWERGKTACPSGNPSSSSFDFSDRLRKWTDSPDCELCCPRRPCLIRGGGGMGNSGEGWTGPLAVGRGRGFCTGCVRAFLSRGIVERRPLYQMLKYISQ
jgi:hypothetical protein